MSVHREAHKAHSRKASKKVAHKKAKKKAATRYTRIGAAARVRIE